MLHSTGYQGELALKLYNGAFCAVTSNDVRKELNKAADDWAEAAGSSLDDEKKRTLHISKQEIRRALARLEEDGRAFRVLRDGRSLRDLSQEQRKGLHEGDILLFCPFKPLLHSPAW